MFSRDFRVKVITRVGDMVITGLVDWFDGAMWMFYGAGGHYMGLVDVDMGLGGHYMGPVDGLDGAGGHYYGAGGRVRWGWWILLWGPWTG